MNPFRWIGMFVTRHLAQAQTQRHDELQAQKEERHDLINNKLAPAAIEAQNLDERVQRLERRVGIMRRESNGTAGNSTHPAGT